MMTQAKSAVIIGAGVSGLSCARRLKIAGWRVQVVDKARGVGGRLSTRRVEAVGAFDIGAQFMTARDPRFQEFLAEQQSLGRVALWSGSLFYGDRQQMVSAKPEKRWVGVPGMNSWVKDLFPYESIRLKEQVQSLERQVKQGWILDQKKEEVFDWVILALPSHQAAALIPQGCSLKDSCQSVIMEPCWTVYVGVQGSTDIPFDGLFVRDQKSSLSWMANSHTKPGRQIRESSELWVLQASASWSRSFFDTPPSQVESMMLEEFRAMCRSSQYTILHVGSQRWRYASLLEESKSTGHLIDRDAGLAVVGDWTAGGRVEGAYLSGWGTGDIIAKS